VDDVGRVHVVDGAQQLEQHELDHLLRQRHLLRVDQPLQRVVHVLHAQVHLVEFSDLLALDLHHVLQTYDVFMFQKFWVGSHVLSILIYLRMRLASPRLSNTLCTRLIATC
jgi:hypothetical protein